MKKIIFLRLLFIPIMFASCNGQVISKEDINEYIKSKGEFDKILTSHFPNKLVAYPYTIINNKNKSKNDICFMLYENDVDSLKIDSIINKYYFVAKYTYQDSCLFLINRFETKNTYENRKKVEILDSLLVNRDCYKMKYPVPNFKVYNLTDGRGLKLDESFNIYVLDAKSGNRFENFNLLPNLQMPPEWQNGYSKGIACSKKDKTLIYWGIIW
ncbi:hypothetical protein J0383_00525 [Flavobacterium endoglycinae]|uniref:Lipoprotein n=1 Tax=Flavobacterium endoglycinae TaxID=2816357 RepID=A0ABX7QFG5_9FLAO|nr:hypothetical protein [Flavobacterium endoglycinae]QSW89313.1 hypothetical protein J0383_00525 [Flavobacterium endoglycinae]